MCPYNWHETMAMGEGDRAMGEGGRQGSFNVLSFALEMKQTSVY